MDATLYEFEPLQPGDPRTVGGYQLRARIGAGGMGRVYLSFTPGGRAVAVKIVRSEFASDPEFRERFAREVSIAQQVNGIHIAQLIDSGLDAGVPWLASAYVAGPSLAQVVAAHGPLPPHTVLALAGRIAQSLEAIHATGMVHRDLKPGNILLDESGPKVIDFGIVRAATPTATGRSSHRTFIGSPPFMAPEQIRGQKVTPATDVFALGATLYYLCTAESAFSADFADGVLYRVIHDEPDYDACPEQVRELIRVCLRKDPAERPTTQRIVDGCRAAGAGPQTPLPDAVLAMIRDRAQALGALAALVRTQEQAQERARERAQMEGPQHGAGANGSRGMGSAVGAGDADADADADATIDEDATVGEQSTTDAGADVGEHAATDAGAAVGERAAMDAGAAGGEKATADAGAAVGEKAATDAGADVGEHAATDTGAAGGKHATTDAGATVEEKAATDADVDADPDATGGEKLGETGGAVGERTRDTASSRVTPLLPPERDVNSMTTATPRPIPPLPDGAPEPTAGNAIPGGRGGRRGRTLLAAGTGSLVTAVAAVVIAALLWPHNAGTGAADHSNSRSSSSTAVNGPATSGSAVSTAVAPIAAASADSGASSMSGSSVSGSDPVQWHGNVLITINAADLDSVPVSNGGGTPASIYDSSTGLGSQPYTFTAEPFGAGSLAVWSGSAPPTRAQCYDQVVSQGVDQLGVSNGTGVCILTAQDRVAYIKVLDDQADGGNGILTSVTVWSGVVSTASASATSS